QGGGGRNRLILIGAIVLIAAIAVGAFLFTRSGGSSKTTSPPASTRNGHTKAAALPTIEADASRFQTGPPLGTQAWALNHKKPRTLVQLGAGLNGAPIQAGKGAVNLAGGDNALWVSAKLPNGGGEVRKFVPGSTAAAATIAYPGSPVAPRVVVANGTIWQPTDKGVVK